MYIAIPGVHVQRDPDAAFEHPGMNGGALIQDGLERRAIENCLQRHAQLRFPAGAQGVVLQLCKQGLDLIEPAAPQAADFPHQAKRLRHAVFEQLSRRNFIGVV